MPLLGDLQVCRGEQLTTIRIEGAKELIAKIDSIAKMNKVKAAIGLVATDLKGKIAQYPPRSSRPNPLIRLNPRVRRGFFYHLKKGDIEVPYRRGQSPGSQKLGQSWNVQQSLSGWQATVGTSVSYARLVQDSANQTSYHRGTGWITTNQVVRLYGQQAVNKIRQALVREVSE